jgi:hypothetical protein
MEVKMPLANVKTTGDILEVIHRQVEDGAFGPEGETWMKTATLSIQGEDKFINANENGVLADLPITAEIRARIVKQAGWIHLGLTTDDDKKSRPSRNCKFTVPPIPEIRNNPEVTKPGTYGLIWDRENMKTNEDNELVNGDLDNHEEGYAERYHTEGGGEAVKLWQVS